MLKLLDPVKDAKEIAKLDEAKKTLQNMPRFITPLLVPLESNLQLADLINPKANVLFDLDGSGQLKQWAWPTPKAAWLVYDSEGTGKITSGLQLFGNVTFWIFWQNGYDALSSLDDNGDGILSGDELRGLALWQDSNGNGISDPGEVRPVKDFGITEISCRSRGESAGNPWNAQGVKFKDGSVRPTYDWIVPGKTSTVGYADNTDKK